MGTASLLLLADGRFPDGSHAHSFGMEAAVHAGRVRDASTLEDYVRTRLHSSTRTDAAAARLAALGALALDDVDAALTLRMPSAAARAASRSLGRSLARTAQRLWPGRSPALADGRPPVQPVAFGAVGALAGCEPDEVALGVCHASAAGLTSAALRLLGMDPFEVAAVLSALRADLDSVVASISHVRRPEQLPVLSTPLAELDPELQTTIEPRLFGS